MEKLNKIWNLLSGSLHLLGTPLLQELITKRFVFSSISHIIFLLALCGTTYGNHTGLSWFILVIFAFFIWPYSYFYHIRLRAYLVYGSYQRITGQPADYPSIEAAVRPGKWSLRLLALLEILTKNASQSSNDNSLSGSIERGGMQLLSGLYDIAEAYLIPTIVIEQLSLTDAVKRLKQLQNNLTAAAGGSLGLDLLGSLGNSLFYIVYIAIFALGALAAYFTPTVLPAEWMSHFHGNVSSNGGPSHPAELILYMLPLYIAVVLISLLGTAWKILASSVKAMYFTCLYTTLNHPEKIIPEMKDKLQDYLAGQTS